MISHIGLSRAGKHVGGQEQRGQKLINAETVNIIWTYRPNDREIMPRLSCCRCSVSHCLCSLFAAAAAAAAFSVFTPHPLTTASAFSSVTVDLAAATAPPPSCDVGGHVSGSGLVFRCVPASL